MAYCTVKNWFMLRCLLRSQDYSSPLLAWKGKSQRALLFFLSFSWDHFFFPKPDPGSQLMEQECHSPAAVLQRVSKQAISLVFLIFLSKTRLKRKRTSMPVRLAEIPWNAAVTFTVRSLLRRLCSCAGKPLGVSRNVRARQGPLSIKSSASQRIPKNSGEEKPGRTSAPWDMSKWQVSPS